jgi:hypothetical protein
LVLTKSCTEVKSVANLQKKKIVLAIGCRKSFKPRKVSEVAAGILVDLHSLPVKFSFYEEFWPFCCEKGAQARHIHLVRQHRTEGQPQANFNFIQPLEWIF